MEQLVGCCCVLCEVPIASELEGRFCDSCGNPVHRACEAKPEALGGGFCAECGANLADAVRMRARATGARRPVPQRRGPYPVSVVCPKCGDAPYKRVKPETFVAFRWDRVCKVCETRYTLPTPLWAAIIFLIVGLILAGFGAISVGLAARGGGFPVCEGFLGFLGLLALVHGIRSLMAPGEV
jgi:hypothetical protein